MTLPTLTKTWVISANNRIVADTAANQAGKLAYLWKEFLKANGYTVKGSSDGTSAAMDGVDRWTDYTKTTTHGTNINQPQSWMVITNGDGVDFCMANQGASVPLNTWRPSVSYGGLYTTAATPTWTPIATDEQMMSNSASGVQMTDSAGLDQVVHLWTSTDKKDFRVVVISQRSLAGQVWGIVAVEPTIDVSVTWPAKSVAFCIDGSAGYVNAGTAPGLWALNSPGTTMKVTKVTPVATPILAAVSFGKENWLANTTMTPYLGVFCNLQNDYMVQRVSAASTTTNAQGKFGWLIDAWANNRLNGWGGYTIGAKQFYAVGHWMWPWDGVTDPLTI